MKTYTFKLIIKEGYDEFWENIKGTGADEVLDNLKATLEDGGWINHELTLIKYEGTKGNDI